MTFDLETTRRDLIVMANKFGWDTPEGHRCSNIKGMLDFLPASFGDQRKALEAGIELQMVDLTKLTALNAETRGTL